QMTAAPSWANSRLITRPMPLLAPVMSATLPSSCPMRPPCRPVGERTGQDVSSPPAGQDGNSYVTWRVPFSAAVRLRSSRGTRCMRGREVARRNRARSVARGLPIPAHRRCTMTEKSTKTRILSAVVGLSLVSLAATACGTLGGAAVGAGAGAAVGAGTGYGAGKGALIGTGVGAAAGAIYDI